MGHMRPHILAGVCGMALIATLYCVHMLLVTAGAEGLGVGWLLLLVLPGALAAHLSRHSPAQAERYGALGGIVTAHFAALLQVAALVIGVLTVDWARYAGQVGPQVAQGLREAALPATLVAGAALVVVTYAGCALAGWLGALAYMGVSRLLHRT